MYFYILKIGRIKYFGYYETKMHFYLFKSFSFSFKSHLFLYYYCVGNSVKINKPFFLQTIIPCKIIKNENIKIAIFTYSALLYLISIIQFKFKFRNLV